MDVFAKIEGVKYQPLLCRSLNSYSIGELDLALSKSGSFMLSLDGGGQIATSWWRSPKRTRSYPYARVYDTLQFPGKKMTIIPIVKDEGIEGDRDYLQWDTISLLSLVGIYAVISYYDRAVGSSRYKGKITKQRFALQHVKSKIAELSNYQSDALHWNLSQVDELAAISQRALAAYKAISKRTNVKMHSLESLEHRIAEFAESKKSFIAASRARAQSAQKRESAVVHESENLSGDKATLTISNYLGGYYYLTCDEVEILRKRIYLTEGKHSRNSPFPALDDIKDGLFKMLLLTNLCRVWIGKKEYKPVPILKLTSSSPDVSLRLSRRNGEILKLLKQESSTNGFRVLVNDDNLDDLF